MVHSPHRYRAFTLIELLVVIMIIGLLTALATTSYINAQRSARDNSRKTGVSAIATAVETFYQSKHRFPGLIGTEGAANIPQASDRTTSWAGCLAIDAPGGSYSSVEYYSFPTVSSSSSIPTMPCNQRTAAQGFVPSQYAPFPAWIPELGEYLNPFPVEKKYQNDSGAAQPLDEGITFSDLHDVLGPNVAYGYAYRHLVNGYMVYARLENTTTDVVTGTQMTDRPKYGTTTGGEVGVTVYDSHVFMIRK